jgi:hypothetical protein
VVAGSVPAPVTAEIPRLSLRILTFVILSKESKFAAGGVWPRRVIEFPASVGRRGEVETI